MAVCTGALGAGIVLHCIWGFAFRGGGTLAPIAPPNVLVTTGLYRYTRNPMYLGVFTVLSSEALFFEKAVLLIYAVIMLAIFHLFVVLHEEPRLKKYFGEQYKEYCRVVPRWRVALRPFRHGAGDR
jgi:protein-S-isoprenylcysteine O-methyltransferase Ste14